MIITAKIFNKPMQISEKMFNQFKQISANQSQIKKIEKYLQVTDISQKTLHILVYYILAILYNVQIQNYERKCRKMIQDQYIQNQMSLNIQGYAIMCGHILQISKHKCAHIIYYLIYQRFVSQRYVQMLIKFKPKQCLVQKKKSIFNFRASSWLKRMQSPLRQPQTSKSLEHQNILNQTTQQFYDQLKAIFRPQRQANQLTSSFSGLKKAFSGKLRRKSREIKKVVAQNKKKDRKCRNIQWIPFKVHQKEKSAIFNRSGNKRYPLIKKTNLNDSILQINFQQDSSSHLRIGKQLFEHQFKNKSHIINEMCRKTSEIKNEKIITQRINENKNVIVQKLNDKTNLNLGESNNQKQFNLFAQNIERFSKKTYSKRQLQKIAVQSINLSMPQIVTNNNTELTRKKQFENVCCKEEQEIMIKFKKRKLYSKEEYKKQMQNFINMMTLSANVKSGKKQLQFFNPAEYSSLQEHL